MSIRLLDCTLRDGGHVNEALFGRSNIIGIIDSLARSNVDIIELGFLKDGEYSEDYSLYSKIESVYKLLPMDFPEQQYSLMIRPDWYDISQLSECNGKVSTLRFAFYYKDFELTKRYYRNAVDKGYKVFLNPVNIMSYTPTDLSILLEELNNLHPSAVSIVDTFGSMMKQNLETLYHKFDSSLSKDIPLSLHLHENMALSFSLAQEFIEIHDSNREIIIDGSLLGMGRIPGNLCIEVIMEFLNMHHNASYSLNPIYDAIFKYIEPIKKVLPWGYSPAYFLTAKYCMHRSYAEYLLEKGNLSCSDINSILLKIETKTDKDFYNEPLVEKIYKQYMCDVYGKGIDQ